jgi:hypothetical protein
MNAFEEHVSIKEVMIIQEPGQEKHAVMLCDSVVHAQTAFKLSRDKQFLDNLEGLDKFGGRFFAQLARKADDHDHDHDPDATRTLRVSGMQNDVTEADVISLFEVFGQIYSCNVIPLTHTRAGARTAYIEFASIASAAAAKTLANRKLGTRSLKHRSFKHRSTPPKLLRKTMKMICISHE